MSTTRGYPRDAGLAARMTFVMFLLGLLYVAVMAALIAAGVNFAFVFILAAGLLFAQYYYSSKIALFSMHAKEVSPAEAPQLHGIVDRLCALADMPKPRVAIADTDVPNAFATGRNPSDAVVCATTGILRRLEPAELEAVLAHELSHIRRGDIAVSAAAGATLGPVLRVAPGAGRRLADRVLEGREAAADVAAVGLTRYPPALVTALERMRDEATGAVRRGPSGAALLWNVAPVPAGTADTVDVRIEALLEL